MTAAACVLIAALTLGDSPPTPSPQTPAPAADTAAPPPPPVAQQPPAVPTARPITLHLVAQQAPAPPAPEPQAVTLRVTADPAPAPQAQAVTLNVQPASPTPVAAAPAANPAAAVPAKIHQPCLLGRAIGRVGECLAKHGQARIYLPRPAQPTAALVAPQADPVQQVVYVVAQPVAAAPVPQAVTASPQQPQAVTLPVVPRKGGLFR